METIRDQLTSRGDEQAIFVSPLAIYRQVVLEESSANPASAEQAPAKKAVAKKPAAKKAVAKKAAGKKARR
jgi:hypothetical protein